MRSLVIPLLAALLNVSTALAQKAADPAPRVEGRVVNLTTGAPLKNARVLLQVRGPVPAGYSVSNYITTSGADGKFVFDSIIATTYSMEVERAGFLYQGFTGHGSALSKSTIVVRAGDSVTGIVIQMMPQGLISGRVLDEDGDPVPEATVEVLRRIYAKGVRRLDEVADETTHADGGFALGGLAPGRYYLRASHRKELEEGSVLGRVGAIAETFVPTLFPTAIDIVAGGEVRGIGVRLKRARGFRVSGQVNLPNTADAAKNFEVNLIEIDAPPEVPSAQVGDGNFEFRDVLPGTYTLRAVRGGGSTTVTVRDEDVTGVALTLAPPVDLTGQVKFEGDLPLYVVVLTEDVPRTTPVFTPVQEDGTFRLRPRATIYDLQLQLAMAGSYVKSIRLDGQEIDGRRIDLRSGAAAKLEIVVSPNAGHVFASVHGADGQLVADANVQVCDTHEVCVMGGSINSPGLAPGDYRVFAWAVPLDGIITSPEFRKMFEGQSVRVTVGEKAHESVDVKLISKESMEAAAAKMP